MEIPTRHRRLASLRSSPRRPDNGRFCAPASTVARVRAGFKRMGLCVNEEQTTVSGLTVTAARLCLPDELDLPLCVALGKGTDPAAARAGAHVKLAERYVIGSNQGHGATEAGRWRYFRQLYDGELQVYRRLDELGRLPHLGLDYFLDGFEAVFDAGSALARALSEARFLWSEAFSLGRRVPVAFPVIWHHLRQRNTGQSAGNTHEEAVVHGIYEVLERHALTRVASERIATPAIDLDSVGTPELRDLIARLQGQGIALEARDISLGLGVPVVAVIFDDRRSGLSGHPLFGRLNPTVIAAARAEPEQAILHCLTEFIEDAPPSTPEEESEVQTQWALRTSLVGARGVPLPDDVGLQLHHIGGFALRGRELAALRREDDCPVPVDALPSCRTDDTLEELLWLRGQLGERGHDVLVEDLTHPVLGLPTVRVIVPGLLVRGFPSAIGPAEIMTRILLGELRLGISSELHRRVLRDHAALAPPPGPEELAEDSGARERLWLVHALHTGTWRHDDAGIARMIHHLESPVAWWGFSYEQVEGIDPLFVLPLLHEARGDLARALRYVRALVDHVTDSGDLLLTQLDLERQLGINATATLQQLRAIAPEFDVADALEAGEAMPGALEDPFAWCCLACERCPEDERVACVWSRVDRSLCAANAARRRSEPGHLEPAPLDGSFPSCIKQWPHLAAR
jgi:ribosomal protein S12 methylthiotransferase accessory factor YcaO